MARYLKRGQNRGSRWYLGTLLRFRACVQMSETGGQGGTCVVSAAGVLVAWTWLSGRHGRTGGPGWTRLVWATGRTGDSLNRGQGNLSVGNMEPTSNWGTRACGRGTVRGTRLISHDILDQPLQTELTGRNPIRTLCSWLRLCLRRPDDPVRILPSEPGV